jgi:hypothetical protein
VSSARCTSGTGLTGNRHTLKADAGVSMGQDGEEDEGPQPPQPLHQGGGVYEADRLSRKSSHRSGVVEADK